MTEQNIIEELKSEPKTFDLGAFVTSNVRFPTRDVKVTLDIERSMEAYDLANEIADLQIEKEAIQANADGGITGGDTEEIEGQITGKTLELSNLVDELDAAALTFTLRGAAPKVWRTMHKIARRDFPIPKQTGSNDDEIREATIAQNEYVEIETVKLATVKVTSPDGGVQEGITTELVRGLYDVLEQGEWDKLKGTAEDITFQVGAFERAVSSDADFLPTSSASTTTEGI